MSDLDPRVQLLLDKQEISELLTRYLRAIDRADIATLRACYLDGATEEHGGIYAGPAQGYIDTIEKSLANPRSVGTHTLTNILIDVEGEQARSEHYVLALTRVRPADGVVSDSLVASRIIDELERRDGQWGIRRRRLRFDWAHDIGPRPTAWVHEQLDPSTLLHGLKFPDDIVYEALPTLSVEAGSAAASGAVSAPGAVAAPGAVSAAAVPETAAVSAGANA